MGRHTQYPKMSGHIYDLGHDYFDNLCPNIIKGLIDDEQFSDVTLILGDGERIKAHRNIVASFSETLKNILEENSEKCGNDFSIYLMDIQSDILRNIKNFIYLGKAQVLSERLNNFLKVGNKLKIKGMTQEENEAIFSEDISKTEEKENCTTEINNTREKNVNAQQRNTNNNSSFREFDQQNMKKVEILSRDAEGLFCCPNCELKNKRKFDVQQHILSIHQGTRYPCDICDYMATQPSNLRQHVKSVHDNLKYSCENCDYKATYPQALKQHVKSVHENVKYPCNKCDYRANRPNNLMQHLKSVHKKK